MSEPKTTAPNTQQKNNSIGALILIILTAIAIIVSLILGGIRLFGQDGETPTESPTGSPSIDPDDPNFKLEAWPSDQPLSNNAMLSGTLLIPTDEYVAENLQKINKGGQFLSDDIQINKDANEALIRMLTAMNGALSFDESIMVHTAYTDKADKDYRTGLTVRFRLVRSNGEYCYLREATGDKPDDWFEKNAWKYGFILRYPEGNTVKEDGNLVSDVYRYVGIPHAYYITKVLKLEGDAVPTLEDYVAHIKNIKVSDSTFEVKGSGSDDGIYNVYYVAAADKDKAMLREGAEIYSVSGVGDGYIVTSYIRTEASPEDSGTEEPTESQTEESK